ncbi:MAG: hypothetical protein K9M99_06225 [Candidatus Cloacimonetes bacterium]|nr:hypothetical protein [Candidatus Cloacimonadota bacterium]
MFLGQNLSVHQISFALGRNLNLSFLTVKELHPYILLGYNHKFFHGKTNDYIVYEGDFEYDYKQFYKPGHTFRFALGFHINRAKNIFKSVQMNFDTGSATRDVVKVYENSEYIGKYEPYGDKVIPDISLSICFTLGYDLHWGGK